MKKVKVTIDKHRNRFIAVIAAEDFETFKKGDHIKTIGHHAGSIIETHGYYPYIHSGKRTNQGERVEIELMSIRLLIKEGFRNPNIFDVIETDKIRSKNIIHRKYKSEDCETLQKSITFCCGVEVIIPEKIWKLIDAPEVIIKKY